MIRTKTRVMLSVAALAMLSGCVSTKTVSLDERNSNSLSGKTITLAVRGVPDFAIMTAGKMAAAGLFGAIGGGIAGASAVRAGNDLVRSNHIDDPAIAAGRTLLAELVGKQLLTVRDTAGIQTQGRKPAEIVKPYPTIDYVLDVETIGWGAMYFPMNWSHYGVMYSTKLSLIDVKSAQPTAEAFCSRSPKKLPDSPTYDELLQNSAARLKALLATAADECLVDLRSKLFNEKK